MVPGNEVPGGGSLAQRRILFCVTGGIAAYKAAAAVSRLRQMGAVVRVVLSQGATAFVTPLTFQALSGQPVWTSLFDSQRVGAVDHVELAHNTDLCIIAPATANIIGKLANGIADGPVSTVVMGMRAPVLLAPAMEPGMMDNPAVTANLERLRSWGWHVIGPEAGHLASGRVGLGRMVEPDQLVAAAAALLARGHDLAGRRLLVTAGPTREFLDPVRFLSNPSSGKMGFAIAAAAQERGAQVTLIHGPVTLPPPGGVVAVPVTTAREMYDAVLQRLPDTHVLIKAAAVSDFRPAVTREQKVKKDEAELTISLARNPDILAEAGRRKTPGQVLVGFAAESHDTVAFAREKLKAKGVDLMVANDITQPDAGFAQDTNRVHFLFADGRHQALPLLSKGEVAHHILDAVKEMLAAAEPSP